MTAHDPRVTLTEAEREAVTVWGYATYTCACEDAACPTVPCDNDRDDIVTTVERLIVARLAPIRAMADEWEAAHGTCGCPTNGGEQLRAALEATEADLSASQDHAWHQPLTHCHCGRVIPCRHHDGADGQGEGEKAGRGEILPLPVAFREMAEKVPDSHLDPVTWGIAMEVAARICEEAR